MSTPAVRDIDGVHYTFGKLCPQDMFNLAATAFDARRAQLKRDCDDAGLSPAERFKAIHEQGFERDAGLIVVRHAMTLRGAIEIINVSLKKNGTALDVSALEVTHNWLTDLALELVGEDPADEWAQPAGETETSNVGASPGADPTGAATAPQTTAPDLKQWMNKEPSAPPATG